MINAICSINGKPNLHGLILTIARAFHTLKNFSRNSFQQIVSIILACCFQSNFSDSYQEEIVNDKTVEVFLSKLAFLKLTKTSKIHKLRMMKPFTL